MCIFKAYEVIMVHLDVDEMTRGGGLGIPKIRIHGNEKTGFEFTEKLEF
jgi:hypothetical protein